MERRLIKRDVNVVLLRCQIPHQISGPWFSRCCRVAGGKGKEHATKVNLLTGAKVLQESTPEHWEKDWATRRTFCLVTRLCWSSRQNSKQASWRRREQSSK